VPEAFPGVEGSDKIIHFCEYYILGYLIFRTMAVWKGKKVSRQAPWITVLIGALYGLSDEWHQSFVPGRDCSGYDAAADVLGVFCAAITFTAVRNGWIRLRVIENWLERGLRHE